MKFLNVIEVFDLIKNSSFLVIDGFVGIGVFEEILFNIEKLFLEKGYFYLLSFIFVVGFGDGKNRGFNRIVYEGLVKKVIGGYWGLVLNLGKLVIENKIEVYNLF